MKFMSLALPFKRISSGFVALGVIFASVALPLAAPFLTETAHAEAPTRVDFMYGGPAGSNVGDFSKLTSCVGKMKSVAMTQGNLEQAFMGNHIIGLDNWLLPSGPLNESVANRYGSFIGANTGKNVNAIILEPAPNASPDSTMECSGRLEGGRFALFPVESKAGTTDKSPDNPKVWVGIQYQTSRNLQAPTYTMIRFTAYNNLTADGLSTPGSLEYSHIRAVPQQN